VQRDPFSFSDDDDESDGTSFGYKFKIHIKAREVRHSPVHMRQGVNGWHRSGWSHRGSMYQQES
jgi:hypothetical protein